MISLRKLNSVAAGQWDYEWNGDMTPDNIAGKSGKEAYFICSNNQNHKWKIKIYQRTNEKGENIDCPYCDGRLAMPGETDFITKCEQAILFWDYDNNEGLDPTKLLPTSRKRANFICPERGHKFSREIQNFYESPNCKECYLVENNITVTHPNIAGLWDFEENFPDKPEKHLRTDSTKVNWKCNKCGYSWRSEIASRTASKGCCPRCDKTIVFTPGFNDIESSHKEILKYWDYENNTVMPSEINFYDESLFNWVCPECGHSWKARANTRIKYIKGKKYVVGCKVCTRKVASIGVNDITVTHPLLASEYVEELNSLSVNQVMEGTNKTVCWRCSKCKQVFTAKPLSRTRYKDKELHGCPFCSGKLPIKGINDFATLHSDIVEEYDWIMNSLNPNEYTEFSQKIVNWKCKNNSEHQWTTSISTRVKGFGKCPICTRLNDGNSFADLHPESLQYWDYILNKKGPEYYTEFSNKSVSWRCKEGHSFEHEIYKYSLYGFYCVICNNIVLKESINDLESIYPEFKNIWDNENNELKPNEVFYSPSNSYFFKCSHGHVWHNTLRRVVETDFTCDYCSNRRILPELNSLQAKYKYIADEWIYDKNESSPDVIFPDNTLYRNWKCGTCGMEFKATTKGRVEGSEYCVYCVNKKATPGKNSFAALYPKLLKEFSKDNDYNPDLVFPDSQRYAIWDCHKYKMQWKAPIDEVVNGQRECPYCNGQRVVPGVTSLKALYKDLAEEYFEGNDVDCDEILPTSKQWKLWKCREYGLIYKATVYGMVEETETCPYCSGRKPVPGVTSLIAKYPDLIKNEWNFLSNALLGDPDTIFPDSLKIFFWKCKKCGYSYKASPSDRLRDMQRNMESCSYCKGLRQKFIHY